MADPQSEAFEWFFINRADNKPTGPVSVRDLEVMWETNEIDSTTYVWKNGMTDWKQIGQIEELKNKILEDTYVPFTGKPIAQPIKVNNIEEKKPKKEPEQPLKVENLTVAQLQQKKLEEMAANKEEESDDEIETLEKKFEKIKKKFYKGPDGLWYIYDEETKQWKPQSEDPNIDIIGEDVLQDLLTGLDEDDTKKKKVQKKVHKLDLIDPDTLTEEELKKYEKKKKKLAKLAEKKKAKWYVPKVNPNLYVRGLPEDITVEQLKEFFSKAGVIRLDPHTGKEKIKIYCDENQRPKGDALISYVKEESIPLAIEMLNEREIVPGYKVYVEQASFEQKGDYVPRKKVKVDKVTSTKIKADQERLLSWDDDETKGEGLRIVVLKRMFTLDQVEVDYFLLRFKLKADPENFVEGLRADVLPECEKLGPVQRMEIFENHPEGVIMVKFKYPGSAENCIKVMNGRYFDGRQIICEYYDGVTDYRHVRENPEDEEKRLEEFGKWIESAEGQNE